MYSNVHIVPLLYPFNNKNIKRLLSLKLLSSKKFSILFPSYFAYHHGTRVTDEQIFFFFEIISQENFHF